MKARCYNPRFRSYKNYGAKGICVCARWHNFVHFFEDMGERPPGHTLDRIDNMQDYSKDNCRWSDKLTQAKNKRTNRMITYKGRTQILVDWEREYKLPLDILGRRLNAGWNIERAFNTPSQRGRKRT